MKNIKWVIGIAFSFTWLLINPLTSFAQSKTDKQKTIDYGKILRAETKSKTQSFSQIFRQIAGMSKSGTPNKSFGEAQLRNFLQNNPYRSKENNGSLVYDVKDFTSMATHFPSGLFGKLLNFNPDPNGHAVWMWGIEHKGSILPLAVRAGTSDDELFRTNSILEHAGIGPITDRVVVSYMAYGLFMLIAQDKKTVSEADFIKFAMEVTNQK